MSSRDLRSIAHRGMALAPSPVLRHQPNGRHMVRDGVSFTRQAYPGPGFNFAAVIGPSLQLERIVTEAELFFKDHPGGYGILVEADAGHPVEAELRAAGWQIAEDEPALVLPQILELPPPPSDLKIRHITDPDELRPQYEMLAAAFETPMEVMETMWPPPSILLDPDIALFVGICDSQRVCGSMYALIDGIATVHGVATLHAYRRRGFGRAITWAALAEGKRRGCTSAALRASGASFDMYRGMGFVPVCNHRTYAVV